MAERTGLTRYTLRYYERDGLMLDVSRDDSGHRVYSERDLGWIELITRLRATGMPVREVPHYAELVRAGDGNEDERLAAQASNVQDYPVADSRYEADRRRQLMSPSVWNDSLPAQQVTLTVPARAGRYRPRRPGLIKVYVLTLNKGLVD